MPTPPPLEVCGCGRQGPARYICRSYESRGTISSIQRTCVYDQAYPELLEAGIDSLIRRTHEDCPVMWQPLQGTYHHKAIDDYQKESKAVQKNMPVTWNKSLTAHTASLQQVLLRKARMRQPRSMTVTPMSKIHTYPKVLMRNRANCARKQATF